MGAELDGGRRLLLWTPWSRSVSPSTMSSRGAAAEHDLSLTQLRLLGILRDRTPTMAAIAHYLGLDPSSVSGLVDRAERRGLVARSTAAHDGRVTIVSMTPSGRELGGRLAVAIVARLEALIGQATAGERTMMVRLAGSMPIAG